MKSDKIFKEKFEKSSDFKFDAAVVNVFDDMVVRSVPYYLEMQRMMAELSGTYAQPGTSLYDLGCSTGTTFLSIDGFIDPSVDFIGIDESKEMLDSCRKNLENHGLTRSVNLIESDLNKEVVLKNASIVIMCLSLQFVRPINRQKLLNSIYQQMNPKGILILIEKVLGESSEFNRQFIKYYYDMKRRNNYDEMEIAQKREALENVLIPYKMSEDITMLNDAGFKTCEVFFKWHNFAGMVAQK
ncbi:MAG TPA: carboxy-S-adenosyl-L-methionine synthase CmoA [Prolixibacteraceae bacterium]|nr:carboxy-S-adenosyl-L-methionine synthase CmoA [Prolixibacteraceae bacterium]